MKKGAKFFFLSRYYFFEKKLVPKNIFQPFLVSSALISTQPLLPYQKLFYAIIDYCQPSLKIANENLVRLAMVGLFSKFVPFFCPLLPTQ
jgi:hypothetical protein